MSATFKPDQPKKSDISTDSNQPPNSSVTAEPPAVTTPAVKKRRKFPLFSVMAVLLVLGLGSLAVLTSLGVNTTPIITRLPASATPANTSVIVSIPVTPGTTAAALNPDLANPFQPRSSVRDIAANPFDFLNFYAATADGLQRSNDGGKTWAEVTEFKGRYITGLAFDQEDGERPFYVATDRAGLFKSTDSGKTWKSLGNLDGRHITAMAVSRRNIYLATDAPKLAIYRSADGGQNWFASTPGSLPASTPVRVIAIDPANSANLFIGTDFDGLATPPDLGRVKFSADSGKTWRDVGSWSLAATDNSPDPTRPIINLLYATGNRLYAGDGERLWRLTPDLAGWQLVSGGLPPDGVYALATDLQLAGLVYAATRDGLYRNSDGQSWQKMATGEIAPIFGTTNLTQALPLMATATTNNTANASFGLRSTFIYALNPDGRLTRYENRDFGKELVAAVPGGSNVVDFTPYGGVNPADKVPAPADGTNDPDKIYIKESGHYIQGRFKTVWTRTDLNGLQIYGNPLSEQFLEFDVQQKITKTVQFFERVKFEITDKPGDVPRLSLIGYEAIEGKFYPPGRFIPTTVNQQYFPETKHTLRFGFFDFWKKNGELARFGYPISEEYVEKTADGREITYQYFERAKFAYDNQSKQTTIALLGLEVLQKRGWLK